MRRLSDTIAGLSALRGMPGQTPPAGPDRLVDLPDFGSNPGNLRARFYVPASLGPRPALVVVLHGCTQTAAGYDIGSGWSKLADEQGFVLLFPEQQRANNPNLCFNWFASGDIARDEGETLSIRQMVATVMTAHDVDPARVFVTGLSAGGAMTAVLLATCPDLFAGGAVIGGLPYGTAVGVTQALARMRGEDLPDGAALGALARRASRHSGPWPTLSVWHGGADTTVYPANAEAMLAQWRALHGLAAAPATQDIVDGAAHRTWCDAAGRTVIEDHRLPRMGHGTPIATQGPEAGGTAGAFMLDVGLSSTRRIAGFWGIAPAVAHDPRQPRAVQQDPASTPVASPAPASSPASAGVAGVINDALRAAGLMR